MFISYLCGPKRNASKGGRWASFHKATITMKKNREPTWNHLACRRDANATRHRSLSSTSGSSHGSTRSIGEKNGTGNHKPETHTHWYTYAHTYIRTYRHTMAKGGKGVKRKVTSSHSAAKRAGGSGGRDGWLAKDNPAHDNKDTLLAGGMSKGSVFQRCKEAGEVSLTHKDLYFES